MNRQAGLPPVNYEYQPLVEGGSRTRASIRYGPVRVEWFEPAFEWTAPQSYAIERHYVSGPLRVFKSRTVLLEELQGTAVEMNVEMQARNLLGAMALPVLAQIGRRGADRALRSAFRQTQKAKPEPTSVPRLFGREQLRAAGFGTQLLDKLARFADDSDDRDLAKIRAYEVADKWVESRQTVLRLFLHATRVGIFNLSWDVLCPSCRGTKQSVDTLSKLGPAVHCDACNIQFGPQFDRSVEVTFNAHPLGKGVETPTYCLAGPHMSRYVAAQVPVAAHGASDMSVRVLPGHYAANALALSQQAFEVRSGAPVQPLHVQLGARGVLDIPPVIAGELLQMQIENTLDHELLFRIERLEWPDTIVTAADITAMQEFRSLFSSEVLAPGLQLSIRQMSVLFTDLVGSTELYSKTGDAPAFRLVTDHFEQLREVIARYDGAIVKTIGDAVMAVFRDSGQCLEAALRLPAAVGSVLSETAALVLRVGFHSGPCIAMQANGRLDYFGTTVNLASRLEHEAGPSEVAFSAATGTFPHLEAVIQKYSLQPRRERAVIKGFAEPVGVLKVPAFKASPTG